MLFRSDGAGGCSGPACLIRTAPGTAPLTNQHVPPHPRCSCLSTISAQMPSSLQIPPPSWALSTPPHAGQRGCPLVPACPPHVPAPPGTSPRGLVPTTPALVRGPPAHTHCLISGLLPQAAQRPWPRDPWVLIQRPQIRPQPHCPGAICHGPAHSRLQPGAAWASPPPILSLPPQAGGWSPASPARSVRCAPGLTTVGFGEAGLQRPSWVRVRGQPQPHLHKQASQGAGRSRGQPPTHQSTSFTPICWHLGSQAWGERPAVFGPTWGSVDPNPEPRDLGQAPGVIRRNPSQTRPLTATPPKYGSSISYG